MGLNPLIDPFGAVCEFFSLTVTTKNVVMHQLTTTCTDTSQAVITVNWKRLKKDDYFCYLGSFISNFFFDWFSFSTDDMNALLRKEFSPESGKLLPLSVGSVPKHGAIYHLTLRTEGSIYKTCVLVCCCSLFCFIALEQESKSNFIFYFVRSRSCDLP